jgi:hypothetical protein
VKNTTMNLALQVREDLTTVWNRSGQLTHDLTELGIELASLDRMAAELTERARKYEPPRQRDGYNFIDPAVDTTDPNETLAILKERLRRVGENLEHAKRLLGHRCEVIRAIVGNE